MCLIASPLPNKREHFFLLFEQHPDSGLCMQSSSTQHTELCEGGRVSKVQGNKEKQPIDGQQSSNKHRKKSVWIWNSGYICVVCKNIIKIKFYGSLEQFHTRNENSNEGSHMWRIWTAFFVLIIISSRLCCVTILFRKFWIDESYVSSYKFLFVRFVSH